MTTSRNEGNVRMTQQVALYLRVSTARQAEKDLSIPDQRRQAESYCRAKGWTVAAEYVEPGASATDDRRPAFQRMIDDACRPGRAFEAVLVHSFSRFFRDAFQLEFYVRKLAKHGVRLVSLTQETGDDPTSRMIRQIMALFDEYQSRENAKHTLRAMKENARQGFWNGAVPPLGYRTVEAERRGDKVKKRLEIEPAEAEIVRLIFDLYRFGDGRNGPLGVKGIAKHLNEAGERQRHGARFTTKTVHEILTRTTYTGRHYFNRADSKTRKEKPRREWIELAVPPVVEESAFEEVRALLKSRRPTETPPRVVNGPTLLTGLATCATCGGGMTLRTGKSGRYRYYTCATCVRKGKTACKGRSVPMATLDGIVTDELLRRLFTPERVETLLREVAARADTGRDALAGQLKSLRRDLRETESRIERLLDAVETGALAQTESVGGRLAKLETRRAETERLIAMTKRQLDAPRALVDPGRIDAFSRIVRQRLADGPSQFRKAYLRLFVERVEVDDSEVRISGTSAALAKGLERLDDLDRGKVPSLVRGWRPLRDSNPCCRRERAVS